MASNTSTSSNTGIGIIIVVVAGGLLALGVMSAVREQETGDTDLPPDPFESNEPRVVDCVGDWYSPREPVIEADIYCEVGDDNFDARDVARSPYVWSTTANTGDTAIIDMYLGVETTGQCSIWVDGELLQDAIVVENVDEGEGPNGEDLVTWYCGIEVEIP